MFIEHLPHVFVEGKTDKYVIIQLLKSHGIFAQDGDRHSANANEIEVVISTVKPNEGSSGSKLELLNDLSVRIRSPKHSAIGYVFDADDPAYTEWSLKSTWDAIRERLAKSSTLVALPETISVNGFHGKHSKTMTPIGIWLMPDNLRDGSVEDFLRELVVDGDRIVQYAETASREAKQTHGALFPEKYFKKAVMQAWLAWQEEPGMTFGTAFQKNRLQKDKPLALSFVSWIQTLLAQIPSNEGD